MNQATLYEIAITISPKNRSHDQSTFLLGFIVGTCAPSVQAHVYVQEHVHLKGYGSTIQTNLILLTIGKVVWLDAKFSVI